MRYNDHEMMHAYDKKTKMTDTWSHDLWTFYSSIRWNLSSYSQMTWKKGWRQNWGVIIRLLLKIDYEDSAIHMTTLLLFLPMGRHYHSSCDYYTFLSYIKETKYREMNSRRWSVCEREQDCGRNKGEECYDIRGLITRIEKQRVL